MPVWKIDGTYSSSPWGHPRVINRRYGAFYWTKAQGDDALLADDGSCVYDTPGFWELEEPQPLAVGLEAVEVETSESQDVVITDTIDDEDIYSAN